MTVILEYTVGMPATVWLPVIGVLFIRLLTISAVLLAMSFRFVGNASFLQCCYDTLCGIVGGCQHHVGALTRGVALQTVFHGLLLVCYIPAVTLHVVECRLATLDDQFSVVDEFLQQIFFP